MPEKAGAVTEKSGDVGSSHRKRIGYEQFLFANHSCHS
ncbi:hypothetical protein BSM4216_0355 [Bacillus smithii]|nr:hypothetical protein BSM4216_0355 [Bacillus smithii]